MSFYTVPLFLGNTSKYNLGKALKMRTSQLRTSQLHTLPLKQDVLEREGDEPFCIFSSHNDKPWLVITKTSLGLSQPLSLKTLNDNLVSVILSYKSWLQL